jgi:proliferating cell nuclear antigen
MDSAHISLCALKLNELGFESFRCDRPITLGINLVDLSKILKMANNDDILILRADDGNNYLKITFNNKSI